MTTQTATPVRKSVISVAGLTKAYGQVTAVDGLSFEVESGRAVGFLGPNGAGKTTTLRMLLGLICPTRGRAEVFGTPYSALRTPTRRVGVSMESDAFVPGRTGRGHLRCYAGPAGCDHARIRHLLELVELGHAADRPVRGYSTGMKQRLSLATALLGDPDLLILDEPANGLDPEGIMWLRVFLRGFADSGRTVLLSTHQLAEAEQLVDDVLLLNRGRLIYSGALRPLLHSDRCVIGPGFGDMTPLVTALVTEGVKICRLPDGRFWVGTSPESVRKVAARAGLPGDNWQASPCNLESAFMSMIHKETQP